MAFTVSDISGARNDANFVNSLATGSFTPTASSLMVLYLWTNVAQDPSSVNGQGGDWTKINHVDTPTAVRRYSLYYRIADASPSAGTVTVSGYSSNNIILGVVEVTAGFDSGDPIGVNGTDSAYTAGGSTDLTPTPTGFTAGNLLLAFYGIGFTSAAEFTENAGMTQLFNDHTGTNFVQTMTAFYEENESAPTANETRNSIAFGAISVEVNAAASGILVPTGPWYGADGKQIKQHPG